MSYKTHDTIREQMKWIIWAPFYNALKLFQNSPCCKDIKAFHCKPGTALVHL